MNSETTIYKAKKIITMNPSNPEGTHVAVRDGRILGVGSLDEVSGWGTFQLDDTFKDNIIVPGFVEAHGHMLEGAVWAFPYIGFFNRTGADGTFWEPCKSIDDVLARIKNLDSQMTEPASTLVAWGYDPLYFPGERLTKEHLDRITARRPIFILHASGHLATINSVLLNQEKITRDTPVVGIAKDEDGEPNGELQELAAMSLCKDAFGRILNSMVSSDAIRRYGNSACNAGVTTITDLGTLNIDDDQVVTTLKNVVDNEDFRARMFICFSNFQSKLKLEEQVQRGLKLAEHNSAKVRFNHAKILLDGSNQGFTGKILWPGYYKGEDHGKLIHSPERLKEIVMAFHSAGYKIHCHCNGNGAVEAFLNTMEAVLEACPRWDHRHTIEHCQTTTQAQYRRMAALGISANIFVNHVYFWGDQHRDIVFGPERAAGMNACATAKREGVRFAIHSDAWVTPLGGLLAMWCAVNRLTATGELLGPHERISAHDALEAVTISPAYLLKMDHEIGSLESGKFADFAVLDKSPLDVDPQEIKDIQVWGTVVGGKKFPAGVRKQPVFS